MSTINEAKMPSLKDKINQQEAERNSKPEVEEDTVKGEVDSKVEKPKVKRSKKAE